jgi:RNA polymerase sigma-70 factor, ECF subfamily
MKTTSILIGLAGLMATALVAAEVQNHATATTPDADALRRQMTKLLAAAIAKLPERFRVVFMLREVEGLSVEETAEALQITRETLKTRLARARCELQQELDSKLRNALQDTFTFAGSDCDALTERVLATFIANGRSQSS